MSTPNLTVDDLPPELLSKIMLYLPLEDRLKCSLTCRRWAEVMESSQLLEDVWLDISGHEIRAATHHLVNSRRQYPNLVLYRADLSEPNVDFWRKISADLRVLELKGCAWSPGAFYAILQQCTKLESLKIRVELPSRGFWSRLKQSISIEDFVPPEDTCHEELRVSLGHLRQLHLDINPTAEVVDLLLGLMPNVTSVLLCPRADLNSDFLERLPSILKKNQIIHTGIYFQMMRLENEELTKFVEATSESLEDLSVSVDTLEESAYDAISKCTRLRRFFLAELGSVSLNASYLERLVSHLPDLEHLQFNRIESLRYEGLEQFSKSKKLRMLKLGPREICVGVPASESLSALRKISTLVKLELGGCSVDSRIVRDLGCLKNLRALRLHMKVDSECFSAICENFERLTELDLGWVEGLTDADGQKLCRFKELESLTFVHGYGFTDLTFAGGVGSRKMKFLFILGCSLTNTGLESIASHHDRLEVLCLHQCERITDAGLVALIWKEPRLKKLYVADSGCGGSVALDRALELSPRLCEWWVNHRKRLRE